MKRLELLLEITLITINNACLNDDSNAYTLRQTSDLIVNGEQVGDVKYVVSQTILDEIYLTLDSAVVELYGNSGNRLTNVEKALNELIQKKSGSILRF